MASAVQVVKEDAINHPTHYNQYKWEVIDVIEEYFKDNYHLGNVFKYIARYKYKGKPVEDLKKASWYLNRYIEFIERTDDASK